MALAEGALLIPLLKHEEILQLKLTRENDTAISAHTVYWSRTSPASKRLPALPYTIEWRFHDRLKDAMLIPMILSLVYR